MIILIRLCVILSLLFALGGCSMLGEIMPESRYPPWSKDSGHIKVTDQIAASESFREEFAEQYNEVQEYRRYVLTRSTQSLTLAKPEGSLNNLIADLLRWHVSRVQGDRIDVGYVPFHLLSDSLEQGPVRVSDIYRIIPQDTKLAVYRVNGTVLKQLADTIAARGGGAVSGMRLRIKDRRADDVLVGPQSIRYNEWYHLAAPANLFCDGKGELSLQDTTYINVSIFDVPIPVMHLSSQIQSKQLLSAGLRETIMQYMSNQNIINRNPDYRIR